MCQLVNFVTITGSSSQGAINGRTKTELESKDPHAPDVVGGGLSCWKYPSQGSIPWSLEAVGTI